MNVDGVFPGPVGQDVYAPVSRYGAQLRVARDGGGRQRLAQGRGAWGGAGRVLVLTPGVVDAVRDDVYGEGSDSALEFVGLDVVEARHRSSWGVSSVASSLSGGWSGFGVGGFSSASAWGANLVSTRYCGPQVSGAPTCVAAAAAAWRRAVVLLFRGGAPGWGVRVSWSWYAHQML